MASAPQFKNPALAEIRLDTPQFIDTLSRLIGVAPQLQNNPSQGFVPKEDLAGDIVLKALRPFTVENGGPLKVRRVSYVEGRGNIVIEYPAQVEQQPERTISFIGSHMDVVPATKESGWTREPFEFSQEGDFLYGRGVTDCLGHVAQITDLFVGLAKKKPALRTSVIAVLIANEENSEVQGVGIDEMMRHGELERIKNGPVFWVDVSDSNPCIGCGSINVWKLTARGKLFHSGFPHKAINSVEMVMEACHYMQDRFYIDFPAHPQESVYLFPTPSTLKPTQFFTPKGQSVNQIPGEAHIMGDIRMTPFYDIREVQQKLQSYIAELEVTKLPRRGPASKYELPDEGLKGSISITFEGAPFEGIACKLDSPGYRAVSEAIKDIKGNVTPFSVTGSLPLVKHLQDGGIDLQLIGFGKSKAYHANDEFGLLSDFEDGTRILARIIDIIDQ